ncbi:secretory lipase-domain-containing protein [Aspergillus avenaceus]|uniref:Secretory lipase-domain-containing protein n=1 Tax=Aspergillus avenaceus TaxID=36643 RepID=A0A5N6TJP8_ASPAV|nr:secretory lipase-domain-containing protein [Aspergillus avenaceus]
MMPRLRIFIQLLTMATVLVGVHINRGSSFLPPSQDPWYAAPEGYEDTLPGTILRIRAAPNNFTAELGRNVSSIFNILYRTTDGRNHPSWAVTTLLVPSNPHPVNGTPSLLNYHIPYNSLNLDYSPSYTLVSHFSAAFNDILPSLARGWYVNIPDFEGPNAAFTVSLESAYAALDSARAAITANKGLSSHSRVAFWGYSGGAFPSEFGAELQAAYAPEIRLAGVAIGGLLPDVAKALRTIDGQPYAGLGPLTVLGLAARYSEVSTYLNHSLRFTGPFNRSTFFATRDMSTWQAYATFANQRIAEYFVHDLDWLAAPALQDSIARNWFMGRYATPKAPLYMYKAVHDEMSPIADTDALVRKYCATGATVLYERNTVGSHLDEYSNGNARAFAWIAGVLEGRDPVGCTVRDVNVTAPPLLEGLH